jgi:hypothetical protein
MAIVVRSTACFEAETIRGDYSTRGANGDAAGRE